MDDESDVKFEFGKTENGQIWKLIVSCKEGLSLQEFGAALYSLADDIMKERLAIDENDDMIKCSEH